MLIKLLFLLAALKLHDVNERPLPPTVLYTVAFFVAAMISGSYLLGALITSVIIFCVSLVYFSLLTRFPQGIENYAIMGLGGTFLVFVL